MLKPTWWNGTQDEKRLMATPMTMGYGVGKMSDSTEGSTAELAKPLVLLVEDEAALLTMLRYNLEKQGFRVDEAVDGQEALTRLSEVRPDLILLDWMLPVMSGIEVCRQIRRQPAMRDLPVIMITARTDDRDTVRGLNTGADGYIAKPFRMDTLLARMRSLLRRAGTIADKGSLSFHDLIVDLAAYRVQRNGRLVHLGPTEFRLLTFLMRYPGRVFAREEILSAVWGNNADVEPRTVDVHIRRLRKAINGPREIDVVRTVRAAGYALDSDSS